MNGDIENVEVSTVRGWPQRPAVRQGESSMGTMNGDIDMTTDESGALIV